MSAIACTYEDREGRCDGDDGFPCPACVEKDLSAAAYFKRQWDVATLEERDPAKYRSDLIESGRGHLVAR